MEKVFVDTNVILRFLLKDNKRHYDKAESLLRKAKAGECEVYLIPEVFLEIDYVLRGVYKLDKMKVIEYLEIISQTPYLEVIHRDVVTEALSYYKSVSVDFADCLLFSWAESENASVMSFDKDFKKLPG